jgi:hypothetical protein
MEGATLRYSTAQLVTRLDDGSDPVWVFFAIPGIAPEFVFEAADTASVEAKGTTVERAEDSIRLTGIEPGRNAMVRVRGVNGRSFRILVMTEPEAEDLWKPTLGGHTYLALSPADLFWTGERLDVRTCDPAEARVDLLPAGELKTMAGEQRSLRRENGALWTRYRVAIPAVTIRYGWHKTRDAGPAPPVQFGPRFSWRKEPIVTVPPATAFRDSAEWDLTLPKQSLSGLSQVYLRLDYAGDIGRAYFGSTLVDDNFYNGLSWEIGLKRFVPQIFEEPLKIEVLPLSRREPIYLDRRAWGKIPADGSVAAVNSVAIVPEYETVLAEQ